MDALDFEEIMEYLTGHNDTEQEIADAFQQTYGIDVDKAFKLVSDLLPLCMVSKSPLTHDVYQGFAAQGAWLAKRKIIQARPGA